MGLPGPCSGPFRTWPSGQALVRPEPVPWLGIEGSHTGRACSSPAGCQRWDISALGLVLSTTLGHPALRAYARGSVSRRWIGR